MVGTQLPVLLDDPAVQPGDEEEGCQETHDCTSSNDCSCNLTSSKVANPAGTALPHDKHCNGQLLSNPFKRDDLLARRVQVRKK
jgi:hypothetical protein